MLTIGSIAYRRVEVFFPIDNSLYSIAFGIHTKTAEPIDMAFCMTSGLGLTNSVRGVTIPEGEGAIWGKRARQA